MTRETAATEFRSMDDYPWKDYRDADGKWHCVQGDFIDLKLENGKVVLGQYRGIETKGGGEAWAFWTLQRGKLKPVGIYEPQGWRPR